MLTPPRLCAVCGRLFIYRWQHGTHSAVLHSTVQHSTVQQIVVQHSGVQNSGASLRAAALFCRGQGVLRYVEVCTLVPSGFLYIVDLHDYPVIYYLQFYMVFQPRLSSVHPSVCLCVTLRLLPPESETVLIGIFSFKKKLPCRIITKLKLKENSCPSSC